MPLLLAIIFFAMLPLNSVSGAEAAQLNCSEVHIVFIVPFDHSMGGMRNVDKNGKPVQMASTGQIVMPFESFRPVSISIDDEFVGHALFGHDKVSPVFNLSSGTRNFLFECEGYRSVKQTLRVIGAGSQQYLIVKFFPISDAKQGMSSDEGSSVQPKLGE
ncbi:hypothetical protein SAMN06265222_107301 [Neorhodopirellula lusitana]|uniref:PEGA domain-containing protein n=1 Tax=Neorhodopirellula lusitana TaxID=445327 RepID=A0ABY1QCG2_9BACT|nr:hypothetical protein [Neorhodopirellula lusitana]SMP62362.1 hypothetical protein SAMN06265222_107301 [Neorhodopirellula lusitana]